MTSSLRRAGVIGWPVGHSRSPRLHTHWLRRYGIEGEYLPIAIDPDHLASGIRELQERGFAGWNVTLPHKEAILPLLDEIDPAARRIGSVNTVVVLPDGRLQGRSTDGFGFVENLRQGAPGWRPGRGPVAVIGAGGSARAVAAALAAVGETEIRIVNRTPDRAEALTADLRRGPDPLPVAVWAWGNRQAALQECHLLVNTTTQGMTGQPPLDLILHGLLEQAVVTDIVYAPLQTPLLEAAAQAGFNTVDGLGMLLHQARPGFAAWFGVAPVVDEALRRAVLAD